MIPLVVAQPMGDRMWIVYDKPKLFPACASYTSGYLKSEMARETRMSTQEQNISLRHGDERSNWRRPGIR